MEWNEREIEKLTKQINNNDDRYNTNDPVLDVNLYQRLTNSNREDSPNKGEFLREYLPRLKLHIDFARKRNLKMHRDGPKQWYSHRHPMGCFMCADNETIQFIYDMLCLLSSKYPDYQF